MAEERINMLHALPNSLTAFRAVGSLFLIALEPMSATFISLYLLLGLSDMLDGRLARSLGATSRFGAMLDGVADAVFILVCLVVLLPFFSPPFWVYGWCVLILFVKGWTLYKNYTRNRFFGFSSSHWNKAAGFLLFVSPLAAIFAGVEVVAVVVCVVATVAAVIEIRESFQVEH